MVTVRPATDVEIARFYRADAEYFSGVVDDKDVALIGFKRVEGRLWGIYYPLASAGASDWGKLFYAFRRELRRQTEEVYVRANDDGAPRLLRMLGFQPAHEMLYGKELWVRLPTGRGR